jgi:hypothetical protein
MANKQKQKKLDKINEKFRSLMEPYAEQLRNVGLVVEWFPENDYPYCSSFSCCLTKHDMDEGDDFIGVCVNAPELDCEHLELYDLDNSTPEIYFDVQNKIREVKDTSITKTGIKIKTKYEFKGSKEYKEKDFQTVLEWAKYVVQKVKNLKQQEKIDKMQADF